MGRIENPKTVKMDGRAPCVTNRPTLGYAAQMVGHCVRLTTPTAGLPFLHQSAGFAIEWN